MNADWAMVAITAIYVIASICIMRANQNSAKTAKAQLDEMKREHDEAARLQVMPYLRFQVGERLPVVDKMLPAFIINVNEYEKNEDAVGVITVVEVANIGQGLAANLTCSWDDMEHLQEFPVDYLRVEEKKGAHFMFLAKRGTSVGVSSYFTLSFHFTDLLGNDYTQDVELNIFAGENNLEVKAYKSYAPRLTTEEEEK